MASATPEPEPKKHWFDTVMTSTPVLLTVIATFMVGQSTSEMTRAQYFRAVASQNQSKVGDQWGFFQAKRIRGQILEGNADMLFAQSRAVFSRATFPDGPQGILDELRAAEKALADKAPAQDKDAVDFKTLIAAAESYRANSKSVFDKDVNAALDALQPKTKKKSKGAKEATEEPAPPAEEGEQRALLKEIIADIKQRKPESVTAPKVPKLKDETLNKALEDADRRADEVYQRGKSIENVLEEFDALAQQQTALAIEFQPIAARRKKADPDKKTGPSILAHSADLQTAYKAARHAYSARRYEDDARSNQDSAYLYEVRVLLSSARSDRHLFRSKMFLFAMLVAQVGVTISTLALAVKRRSIVWRLAAMTGLIASILGIYVYLDLP